MSFTDKVVLVTGASRGLGRAVAEEFLTAGAYVFGTGRDPAAIAEAADGFRAISESFRMTPLDVCDEPAVTAFIGELDRLDVLVNNAGIYPCFPFLDTPTQNVRDILEVNVIGAFVVMREAVRKMLEHDDGVVINIGSDASVRGIPGMASYVASKHALLGLSRSARLELHGSGVRVTTFCPGGINLDVFGPEAGESSMLSARDLARTIAHLATLPPTVEVQELLVQSPLTNPVT